MSAFPSALHAGGHECQRGATSNPFVEDGGDGHQHLATAGACSLHPSQHIYVPSHLAGISSFGNLTPLSSPPPPPPPPSSVLGQSHGDVVTLGSVDLACYGASSAYTPTHGTASHGAVPAGTWPEDAPNNTFAGHVPNLTLSAHPNATQDIRGAPRAPELPYLYQGPLQGHQDFSAELLQGGDSIFYGWPTPPLEDSHCASWSAECGIDDVQNFRLPANLLGQPDSAASSALFGGDPGTTQHPFLGLYAPTTVPSSPAVASWLEGQGEYFQRGLGLTAETVAEGIASKAREHSLCSEYEPKKGTSLHLAAVKHEGPQPAGNRQLLSCGMLRHPTPPKRKLTTAFWEEERTTCYQVDARGVCVARRRDNHMVNGTKLLNVAGLSRGKRDAVLKGEKERHVVRSGPMPLKGVWIPFERALALSAHFGIVADVHPLFESELDSHLAHPDPC